MRIQNALVVGGAGYIGSHMVRMLLREGWRVTVLDDLSTGHAESLDRGANLIRGSLLDQDFLSQLMSRDHPDIVMHFAALSIVGDSVADPLRYYHQNIGGTINLLRAMIQNGVGRLVFSSTAALFGNPQRMPIDEACVISPLSPYGASKYSAERIIEDVCRAHRLRAATLRYFNAAGADAAGDIGESHKPETHLIPNVLRAALGQGPGLLLFGDAHATPDGFCVRDYVHVNDLCSAHLLAAQALAQLDLPAFQAYNLGNGHGFSVMEVLRAAESVVGHGIPYRVVPARAGDPPSLVASSLQARELLGWAPAHQELGAIIQSAWRWHQNPRY